MNSNSRSDYIKEFLEKKVEETQTPTIQIKDLSFTNKNLSVSVINFLIKETEKGSQGRIGIHICIKNSKGAKLFDSGKTLTPQKDTVTISIPFTGLKKGKYDIVVDVRDFLTGKTAQEFIQESVR